MNLKNQITTIFFDLFGVLLGADQSVVIQYLSQLIETPYLQTRENVMGEPFMRLERREINFTQYVDEIRTSLPNGNRIEEGPLRDIWMNSGVGEMPAVSLIKKLLADYRVWIISNTTESHIKILHSKFTFLSLVGGIITSERAGTHKPDPEIFHFALSEANTDATSSIFIDDSYINVKSAENLGIISHRYACYDELMGFIKENMKI